MNLFVVWISLTTLTVFTRVAPLFGGKWLGRQRWLEPISTQLPCMILVLLIVYDLEARNAHLFSAIAGLIACTLCFKLTRHSLFSITIGVGLYFLTGMF